jgi:hypothetical protein
LNRLANAPLTGETYDPISGRVVQPYSPAPQRRVSETPPYAGAERVLGVENEMSDAGIRKSIPGFAPSGPTVPALTCYTNPYVDPESVRKSLND